MVFQKSTIEGLLYDVISLTHVDEEGRVRREAAKSVEEVPELIRENFEVRPYEEATGKRVPGKYLVTLCKEKDEKGMITLFLLERAWPLSPFSPREKAKTLDLLSLIKKLEKTDVEELYKAASEEFGLSMASLERDGKVRLLEGNYVKLLD